MKYLHTMIRVSDPDETIRFFNLLGLEELRRMESEQGRFTLIFLAVVYWVTVLTTPKWYPSYIFGTIVLTAAGVYLVALGATAGRGR